MGKLPNLRKLTGISLLLLLVVTLYYSKLLQPLDRIVYDSQIRFADRQPLDDIVIIAIDKVSLDQIGRWPWTRDTHADFLRKIAGTNTRVVVLDILFSEPSDIEAHDRSLAAAIAENGKVILPVAVESARGVYNLTENLPLESLQNSAAGIGHVNRELDIDAIARTSYLYAGLSDSLQWPSIALQAIWTAGTDPRLHNQGNYPAAEQKFLSTSDSWTRSEKYLLPFAGKPGVFKRISYIDVLGDNFDLSQLNNKFVLVGTTAVGLGDVVSTPVSGEHHPMPGIEVIANEIDSLRQGLMITQMSDGLGLFITLSIVLLSFIMWNFLPPRYSLFCAGGLIGIILLADAWLLHQLRVWFPPANLIFGVALGYLGWLWGRLVETVKYLNSELNRLGNISTPLLEIDPQDGNKAFEYLMKIDGFDKGQIKDNQDKVLFEWNSEKTSSGSGNEKGTYLTSVEVPVKRNNSHWKLSLEIDEKKIHPADAENIANQLTAFYLTSPVTVSRTPVEFINSRIELVKAAYSKMHSMNDFISEVFDQLYNSVVVTDTFGNLVMVNRGSDKLLEYDENELQKLNVLDLLNGLNFANQIDWHNVFSKVMFKAEEFVAEAKTPSGQYLLIEITRYAVDGRPTSGMVFNFIDVTTLKETEQSRRELLAFLSHDLRSPLASLIATSDLAKLRPEYRESETFIKSIKDNAKRALQLADDFLALMRAESITADSFKPVNFNSIVSESIAAVEGSAKAKSISIHKILDDHEQLFVNGDKSVLERVLINLLSNAIKYSPIDRKIEIGAQQQSDELYCYVKDNGYGIREQDKEKVFQRFERISHEGSADDTGTGLGLAFVKSSVERHKGRIRLDSELGKGSCIHIHLPLFTGKLEPAISTAKLSELNH